MVDSFFFGGEGGSADRYLGQGQIMKWYANMETKFKLKLFVVNINIISKVKWMKWMNDTQL